MKKIFSLLALVAVLLGCSSMFTGCSTLRGDQAYRPNEPLAVTAKISADLEASTFNPVSYTHLTLPTILLV